LSVPVKIIFVRRKDLPFEDMDGHSVNFRLSRKREGVLTGSGVFNIISSSLKGLVRLEIVSDLTGVIFVRVPMRKVFLPHIVKNPSGSKYDFTLDFQG